MSDYTEGSMQAIVCGTGVIVKVMIVTWTNHFLEGYAPSELWCPFQAPTS